MIKDNLINHLEQAKTAHNIQSNNIIMIGLQGSQNYNLDIETSDVDTKLFVTPTLRQISSNQSPLSTTYVRPSDNAHTDLKDIRLYLETLKKANVNFVELLYTSYIIINEPYQKLWYELINNRERISHYNPARAVKAAVGVALEKYHAMEHRYPSRAAIIDEFGYDPKQLHHLARMKFFIRDYVSNKPYIECIQPIGETRDYLLHLKTTPMPLERAREEAVQLISEIKTLEEDVLKKYNINEYDKDVVEFLDDIQYRIIKTSLINELGGANGY